MCQLQHILKGGFEKDQAPDPLIVKQRMGHGPDRGQSSGWPSPPTRLGRPELRTILCWSVSLPLRRRLLMSLPSQFALTQTSMKWKRLSRSMGNLNLSSWLIGLIVIVALSSSRTIWKLFEQNNKLIRTIAECNVSTYLCSLEFG